MIMVVTLALADIGKVAVVKGDAVVQRDKGEIKAYNSMGLLKRDSILTKQGRMQMHFNDNTVISLGRDSYFVIEEYLYVENSQQVAAKFKLEKGFIKTITGAIAKVMPELFTVKTSTTEITPHGTIWSVKVSDEDEVYKVLEGSISLAFNDGIERKIELKAGERAIIKKTEGVVKSFKKSKINIPNFINSQYEDSLEKDGALVRENQNGYSSPNDETDDAGSVDDGNNGHGDDESGRDNSNPGLN